MLKFHCVRNLGLSYHIGYHFDTSKFDQPSLLIPCSFFVIKGFYLLVNHTSWLSLPIIINSIPIDLVIIVSVYWLDPSLSPQMFLACPTVWSQIQINRRPVRALLSAGGCVSCAKSSANEERAPITSRSWLWWCPVQWALFGLWIRRCYSVCLMKAQVFCLLIRSFKEEAKISFVTFVKLSTCLHIIKGKL